MSGARPHTAWSFVRQVASNDALQQTDRSIQQALLPSRASGACGLSPIVYVVPQPRFPFHPSLILATPMPQYLIERNIPGAGKLTPAELKAISQKSCSVLNTLGPQIQWVHSYVTDDQIHCIYRAPNEEMIREHARQGGFPADRVSEIKTIIDPTTAE
jgi:hypothetical protein